MSRYDKYDPHVGNFRAPLAADLTSIAATGNGNPIGVSLDANGRVVVGAVGNTGIFGLLVTTENKKLGDIVDVMRHGEIVEVAGLTAGTTVYVNATTGALETTAPAAGTNKLQAGRTVEATRLVVDCQVFQG